MEDDPTILTGSLFRFPEDGAQAVALAILVAAVLCEVARLVLFVVKAVIGTLALPTLAL